MNEWIGNPITYRHLVVASICFITPTPITIICSFFITGSVEVSLDVISDEYECYSIWDGM